MEQRRSRFVSGLSTLGNVILVLSIGVLGLVMAHHPTLFSGFRRIQTDLGDTRFNHYLLEHGYLWMRGEPGHRTFWNLPIFYPVSNTAAYSDLLLSVGPVYWLWRAVGASHDLAFIGWMISISALNYASALVLFHKGLKFAWLPSAAAGFLVAFGAPRINQMSHHQMLPCFFVVMTVFALVRLFGSSPTRHWERVMLWLLAVLGCVLQLYGGFYMAWFLILAVGIALARALLIASNLAVLLEVIRRDSWMIVSAGLAGILLLLPLLKHYLPVAQYLESRQYIPMYYAFNPRLWSWLNVGANHWLWGWTAGREPFRDSRVFDRPRIGIRSRHSAGVCGGAVCWPRAADLPAGRDRDTGPGVGYHISAWEGNRAGGRKRCLLLPCVPIPGDQHLTRSCSRSGVCAGDAGARPVPGHVHADTYIQCNGSLLAGARAARVAARSLKWCR